MQPGMRENMCPISGYAWDAMPDDMQSALLSDQIRGNLRDSNTGSSISCRGSNDEIDKGERWVGSYPVIYWGPYGRATEHIMHRHRYEFNNAFRDELTAAGLVISGTSPDGRLVETIEMPGCDFNVGVQFHPEFKSRPNRPHPLFLGLVGAALGNSVKGGS